MSHCGNNANRENGNANAIAKPNIPIAGANRLCPAASTNSVPMIGPVQLNETITNVNAISNILRKPPVLRALLSRAVDQLSGRVISNSPKNDNANTTSIRKKTMFTTALVLRSFNADAPNRTVTSSPKPTYRMMILTPYRIAFCRPLSVRLRKNETVMGIIGHTHGVKIASNPPSNPSKKITHNERLLLSDVNFPLSTCELLSTLNFERSAS